MSTSLNASPESRVLPDATRSWLLRRVRNGTGLSLTITGLLLAVALLGYNPADPSLNAATAGPIANPLGVAGAWIADLGLQSLGLAAGLLAVILCFWGCLLYTSPSPRD